jgi:four helix bundle protein
MSDLAHLEAPYESLAVYRYAIKLRGLVLRVADKLPPHEVAFRQRLKTSAMSVPLNIAEGSRRAGAAFRERARANARAAAIECGALIDACTVAGHMTFEEARRAKRLLLRMVTMLGAN